MRKSVKWCLIIIAIIILISFLSKLFGGHRRYNSNQYNTSTYSSSYNNNNDNSSNFGTSLAKTAVRSAVSGAGAYAGYHIAKKVHHMFSGDRHSYSHRYNHSRR